MNSKRLKFVTAVTACCLAASAPAFAQMPKMDLPLPVTAISPIFSQLVRFTMPSNFTVVFENTNGPSYIREAVPKGETTEQWTQMITVSGARDAATKQFTPQGWAERMAGE